MIRFTIICLTTLGVLGALFMLLVYHAQPNAAVTMTSPVLPTATPIATTRSADGLGPGSKPWLINYDDQGKIVSKFTADEFTPNKDGTYDVINPIAVFYLDKGQIMRVTGDRGKVQCDTTTPGNSKGLLSGPTNSPRTGLLHQVHIALFPSADSTRPTQWMDADNIHFDNDHLRMWTETIKDEHDRVITESDQVPVTIRGDEYEFDGKGMTLIWNGVSRRLEELLIVHGEKLVIKDTSKLALPGMTAPEPAKQTVTASPKTPVLRYAEEPGLSASKPGSSAYVRTGVSLLSTDISRNRSTKLVLAQPSKPANKTEPPTPYRAIFHDNIKITDADRTMATADLMTVDFLQASNNNPKPVAASAAPATPPTSSPVQKPVIIATAPPGIAPTPSPRNANKSVNGPITIYWTGTLIVTPLRGESNLPLAAGQSIVKLQGKKVLLTPEGSTVECAAATYRSPDGAALLESSPELPRIHLTQVKGLDLLTETIDYQPAMAQATLVGPSELKVPVGSRIMNVKWSKTGVLHVVRLPGQPNGVDQVDLADDVDVEHPQFSLTSARLQLQLDLLPKAKTEAGQSNEADEQLKVLTASDNVHCRLIQAGKTGSEGIDSDELVIRTERSFDGSTVPREVDATGHVHAFDPEQWIDSAYLKAMLSAQLKDNAATKPATQLAGDEDVASGVELESLYARTKVKAHLKTGATADTNELTVTGPQGFRNVMLNDPANGTTLKDGKKSSLNSTSIVEITPDQGGVKIDGTGTMHTVRSTTQPSSDGIVPPPQPMDVSWRDSMKLDSANNVADLYGNVQVVNHEADGAKDTITGDSCHIDLVDSAKNEQGKKEPAKTETKKSSDPSDDMRSAMGGKDVKQLTLTGHVIGVSELFDPNGAVLRQGLLHGDKLIYTAADQTAVIPGPGTMFVENHKPDANADAKAANTGAGKDGADTKTGPGNNRGEMAIEWKKQLTFNQLTQIITITGDTSVHFKQEPPAAKPGKPVKPQETMHLYAQKLVITMDKAPPEPGHKEGKTQVSRMNAYDQVRFMGPTVDLTCTTVDYDPLKGLLNAMGTPQQPGETMNATQTVTGLFDELEYDTINEEVLHVKGSQVQMRH